ncbi:MAG: hypothetical protein ACTTJ6_03045 [Treponema sp.]
MSRKPWVNFSLTLLVQSISLLFLLLFSYIVMEVDFFMSPDNVQSYSKMQVLLMECVFLTILSLIPYIIFFILERIKAKREGYLEYLKLSTRVIWAVSVLIANIVFIILFCFLQDEYGVPSVFQESILEPYYFIFPLIVFVLINLIPFIFFKPRP